MKVKIFVFFSIFLLFVSGAFAFDVKDLSSVSSSYFSTGNDDVKIINDLNVTNVSVSFTTNSQNFTNFYNFTKCDSKFCIDLSLSDLIVNEGGPILSLNEFLIKVGNEEKKVYLDTQKPEFDKIEYVINSEKKQIEFSFNYSDNSNKISKVEILKKLGNDLVFVSNLTGKNSYNYSVLTSENYIFTFRVYDKAGNNRVVEKVISVGDIFAPQINSIFIVLKDDNYDLTFNISDYNLTKYEIIQGNLELNEKISGTNYVKTINLPFENGDILFRVYDFSGNSVNKTLSLKSPFSNKFFSKYSNSKTFKFESNADNCYLIKVGSKSYNDKFTKSSKTFSKELDISNVGEYNIEFYCEANNFREYFSKEFYYDINKPSASSIEVLANDKGGVDISWNKSIDLESEVSYKLYRDSKVIYEGSKLEFVDISAVWPTQYKYFVESLDEAQNSIKSESLEIVPKKVKISLITSLKSSQDVKVPSYKFELNTDINSNVKVLVRNGAVLIKEFNMQNTTASKLEFQVELIEGVNKIEVLITDEFANKLEQVYFVSYEKEILAAPVAIQKPVVSEKVIEPEVNLSNTNSSQAIAKVVENSSYWWVWALLFLVLLIVFLWIFVFNEDKLKSNPNLRNRVKKNNNKNHLISNLFSVERSKDNRLEKDFNRIKNERIEKQLEKEREERKRKEIEQRNRGRSELEKEKFKDLATKKEIFIPHSQRQKQKERAKQLRKEPEYDELLEYSRPKNISKDQREKNDNFYSYIQKVKSSPSWNSNKDYVYQEPKPQVSIEEIEEIVTHEQSLISKRKRELIKEREENKNQNRFFSIFKKKNNQEDNLKKERSNSDFISKDLVNKTITERSRPNNNFEDRKEKKVEVLDVFKQESKYPKKEKIDLDVYLNKKIKNKKRFSFFAEREVENDLRDRKDN